MVLKRNLGVIGNDCSEEFPGRAPHPYDSVLRGREAPVMAEKLQISITHLTGQMTHNRDTPSSVSLCGPLVPLVSDVWSPLNRLSENLNIIKATRTPGINV